MNVRVLSAVYTVFDFDLAEVIVVESVTSFLWESKTVLRPTQYYREHLDTGVLENSYI